MNQRFADWLGRPTSEIVGKRFQELLTVGGRIFHQTHWAPLLRMQSSLSEVKLDLLRSDGTTVPMMLNAFRHVEAGEIVHELAAFVARDRDKYEKELVAARKRVEELHESAKDRAIFAEQMIGIVSHDLRNPMSSIGMAAALLAQGENSATQKRILARLTRAADRANSLIADLLDFTQARLGNGLPIAPEAIDLHDVIADTIEDLLLAHPGHAIEQVRRGEGGCSAEANRLSQLVGNLVSNAAVYGTPGTPITVTSTIEATTFSLSVHNTGAPIRESIQEGLFSPMTRGSTAANVGRSVGLGLFIVREIARAHGGTAAVKSTPADGTTFTAVFPRRG